MQTLRAASEAIQVPGQCGRRTVREGDRSELRGLGRDQAWQGLQATVKTVVRFMGNRKKKKREVPEKG